MVTGADIVVQSLINHGVEVIFAYPGGASMPLAPGAHARSRTSSARSCRGTSKGGGFAAQGYARTTGKPGVCMATSGPGATNLVTCIADAKLDSIPLIAITGQVGTRVIGTDAFQETPIVEVCRGITKHHYLVTDVNDLARVDARGVSHGHDRPAGPGADRHAQRTCSMAQTVPDYDVPMNLPGYHVEDRAARPEQIAQVAAAIKRAKRPVIYAGGGIIASGASAELQRVRAQDGHSGHA